MRHPADTEHYSNRALTYGTVGFLLVAVVSYLTRDGDLTVPLYVLGGYLMAVGLVYGAVQAVAAVQRDHEDWRRRLDRATREES